MLRAAFDSLHTRNMLHSRNFAILTSKQEAFMLCDAFDSLHSREISIDAPLKKMKFFPLFLQPFWSYSLFRSYCSNLVPTLSTVKRDPTTEFDARLVEKIIHILKEVNPIEPEFELLAHKLSTRVVSSVIQNPPNLQLGFRFFIWATRRRWLKTWQLHQLIIDMLLGEGQEGGFNLYWKSLKELKDSEVPISSDAFLVLFLGYWEAQLAAKAVEAFGRMRHFGSQPNVYAYNCVLYLMVQKDVIVLALAVYNQMVKSNCSPNLATYSILIDGLCKIGKTQDALNLFDEMARRSISPNNVTYSIVLSGLCKAKRVDDADLLFTKMASSGGCSPDKITCNAVLNGFCKLGRMDEAFMLLKLFQPYAYTLGIEAYSCIIDGLFRVGRFEEANGWFKKFCLENIKPDVELYTIMIRGCSEAGRVEDALQFLKEMRKSGLVPDIQCYNALIKGYCKLGFVDDAMSLMDEIPEKGCFPDVYTYTILIRAMCEKGLIEDGKHIFEEMEKRGCFPSVVTFNAFIDALGKAGDLDAARLLFCKMEIGKNPPLCLLLSQGANRVVDSSSLQQLVQRLCDSGLYLKAYKILSKLIGNGAVPNIFTYNILINHMCKAGHTNGALKLFKELQVKGLSHDSVTFGTLIDGLYRVGREEDALKMFDQSTKNETSPSSSLYKSLMTWLSRKGKVLMTFTLWLTYLRSLQGREDEALKLISRHLEGGEVVKAVEGFLELDFRLKQIDLGPYTIWIIGLCEIKRIEEALEIFHLLVARRVNVSAPSCVMLIRCLSQEGKLDQAVDVFLYTLQKGLKLKQRICDYQLNSALQYGSDRRYVRDLIRRMESEGYDMDSCIYPTTKTLLEEYLYSA